MSKNTNIKALILAGGQSKRMGIDKSEIKYHHSISQQIHIANLCQSLGLETFISKAHTEERKTIGQFPVLKDEKNNIGPIGAIVTAFMHDAQTAWLVLPCDLPYLDAPTIKALLINRNKNKLATAYKLTDNKYPEPLMAIYEPEIYQSILISIEAGITSLMKILMSKDIHTIPLDEKAKAYNANNPKEKEQAFRTLKLDQ